MKLFIHLGPSKTGSTSIQKTLYSNRAWLSKNNILYLESLGYMQRYNHNILQIGSREKSAVNPRVKQYVPRGPYTYDGVFDREIEYIRSQIDASHCSHAVLSGEGNCRLLSKLGNNFWNRVFPYDNIDLEFIWYYRDPPSRYLSEIQEKLKIHHSLEILDDLYRPAEILAQYEKQYPGKVHVRCFETCRREKTDLAQDFLNTIAPQLDVGALVSTRENETMTAEAMVVLQTYRRSTYPETSEWRYADVDRLMHEFQKLGEMGHGAKKPKLKPSIEDWLYRFFSEDIEWIDSHYEVDVLKYRNHKPMDQPREYDIAGFTDIQEICEVDEARLSELRANLPKWCTRGASRSRVYMMQGRRQLGRWKRSLKKRVSNPAR